jgi:hypothetical protein
MLGTCCSASALIPVRLPRYRKVQLGDSIARDPIHRSNGSTTHVSFNGRAQALIAGGNTCCTGLLLTGIPQFYETTGGATRRWSASYSRYIFQVDYSQPSSLTHYSTYYPQGPLHQCPQTNHQPRAAPHRPRRCRRPRQRLVSQRPNGTTNLSPSSYWSRRVRRHPRRYTFEHTTRIEPSLRQVRSSPNDDPRLCTTGSDGPRSIPATHNSHPNG